MGRWKIERGREMIGKERGDEERMEGWVGESVEGWRVEIEGVS